MMIKVGLFKPMRGGYQVDDLSVGLEHSGVVGLRIDS